MWWQAGNDINSSRTSINARYKMLFAINYTVSEFVSAPYKERRLLLLLYYMFVHTVYWVDLAHFNQKDKSMPVWGLQNY